MRRVFKPLLILLALVFLFEAWLWEHLRPLVAWVVGLVRWDRLKARLAAAIEHLPPYPTLLVFLIPVVLLFPLKLLGLWMLAHGSWLGAFVVLALAKVVSMGVTAFIFELTRPKLLQLNCSAGSTSTSWYCSRRRVRWSTRSRHRSSVACANCSG